MVENIPTTTQPITLVKAQQRSASADLLKAISIFAVVFIHGAFLIPFTPSFLDWISPAMRFCVPVFVLLWAYFSDKGLQKREDGFKYLFTRFYKLFIPFVFWSTIYFFLIADFDSLTPAKMLSKHWAGRGWSGQYYFLILFQLIPFFILLCRISLPLINHHIVVILLSILFYSVVTYWSFFNTGVFKTLDYRPFTYWIPYVILGISYSRQGKSPWLAIPLVFAIAAPFIIALEHAYLSRQAFVSHEYIRPGIFVGTLVMVHAFMNKKLTYDNLGAWPARLVNQIAGNTFGIFCLNPLVITSLSPLFPNHKFINFPGAFFIVPIFSTLFIIGCCLSIIWLLKRIRLGILVNG